MATKNTGEEDELIANIKLIELRDTGGFLFGKPVKSVGFAGKEFLSLPKGFNIAGLSKMDDAQLGKVGRTLGVNKAPALAKADVFINGIGYSIKSNRKAPPALINHTARPGFEKVCNRVGAKIDKLDGIIAEYWRLRNLGIISEDTANHHSNSPFYQHKEFFRPILNYFLFQGTGKGDSKYPAKHIIGFSDPLLLNTWSLYDESNALDTLWDDLIFCLRAKKGMPKNYPNVSPRLRPLLSSYKMWTTYIDGGYRGALHIRSK